MFSDEMKIDMRFVCPEDVKRMVVQRARSVHWKKWAAKHEYEVLKEGAWLEPGLALLRKKVRENCTEKHRNFARKIFWEGGWTQKEIIRYWLVGCWSMSSLPNGGRHRGAQALPLPRMVRSQTRDSRGIQEVGTKSKNIKEGMEVAKRYRCASSQ